jgi:Flp pilus assembly protein TadG
VLGDDRGGVTVEAAVAVCGLVAVLALGVSAVMAVVGQLRCTDAAREAARLVARGDDARVGGVVEAIAPQGARWSVGREGDTASVEVAISRLGVELRARAYAVLEPGVEHSTGIRRR